MIRVPNPAVRSVSRRSVVSVLPLLFLAVMGCSSPSNSGDGFRFAGDWCTLRTLASDGLPVEAAAHIGGVWIQQGQRIVGSGSVKRAGETQLWPSRYTADIVGNTLLLEIEPLEQNVDAPRFAIDLVQEGRNDLVGTASGDPGFNGPITLVPLGPRCFVE